MSEIVRILLIACGFLLIIVGCIGGILHVRHEAVSRPYRGGYEGMASLVRAAAEFIKAVPVWVTATLLGLGLVLTAVLVP
ncbi:MAG: hypothetical protein WC558_05820 [Patulibacter sp.]